MSCRSLPARVESSHDDSPSMHNTNDSGTGEQVLLQPTIPHQQAESVPPRARMVTIRAVVVALLLMPLNAYWVISMEAMRYSGHPTTISLFFNVVFILVILIGLNALVRKVLPRAAFAPGEL